MVEAGKKVRTQQLKDIKRYEDPFSPQLKPIRVSSTAKKVGEKIHPHQHGDTSEVTLRKGGSQ